MIALMKKANDFQIVKVQPQVFLSFCLFFCWFQPDFTYKSVVCKRKPNILRYLANGQSLKLREKCSNKEFLLLYIFLYSDWIQPKFRKIRTRKISVFGHFANSLKYQLRVHETTIGKFIFLVCEAIYNIVVPDYMKWPFTKEQWKYIIDQTNNY